MKEKSEYTHEISFDKLVIKSPNYPPLCILQNAQLKPLKGGKVRNMHSWSEIEQLVKKSKKSTHVFRIEK